ncbi:spore cortex biosynthesis protein YabQ [Clostridium sp.]|uniref:spore cortex biosynthesis protein YabQ n=1 Tax=Clostridium sp. TaxID=1506 RepID=UPI003F31C5F2
MPLNILVQVDIVVYAILAGLLTGIIFDLYRIIRGVKLPKVILIFEDILFWILTALIVFTFLLYTNYAFLGPYVYAFMVVSLIIYIKFISPTVFKFEKRLFIAGGKVTRLLFKNAIYPFKVIYSDISGKNNSKTRNIKK